MNANRFQNALRIMWNLDRHELVAAGVLAADDEAGWRAFRDHPHNQALRFDGERFAKLWALVESRQRVKAPKVRYALAPRRCAAEVGPPVTLYNLGDVRLAWVNEGDLYAAGEEVR